MTLQNVRFKGLVKTTAELESDKFAGRIGWNSTLARFVAYFSSTNYATMARKDISETFPGLAATNLTQNRVVAVGANGQLVDDAGLTRTQTSGVTTSLTVGDGNVAGAISILSNAAVGQETSLLLGEAGATKLQIRRTASGVIDFRIPGVDIPISFPEVAGGDIALGGSGSTKRDVNLTGNLKLAGTQRISSAGRFDASSLYNSAWAGGGVRMLATDNVGMGYAMDAATARATLGITRDWGYASGGVPAWIKVAQMRISAQYETASFSARVTDSGISGAGDYGTVDVVGRIRQNSPMSSPLDFANLIVSRQVLTEIAHGYVVEADSSAEKVVSVYVALIG